MKQVDVWVAPYFNGLMMFLGALFVILGIVLIITNLIAACLFFALATIIFTTHYRVRVNFEAREYFDYLWILGFRHGEKGTFDKLEYLFIKKNKISETMRLRVVSSTIRRDQFDAYLKFSEKEKIHLLSRYDKKSLVKFANRLAVQLHCKVVDYAEHEPAEA